MASNKLKIQAFRANDLDVSTGKQFELGKSWCDFLEIDNTIGDITLNLLFKPLNKAHEGLKDKLIELQLSAPTLRNDRKAYANGKISGYSAIKEFFLQDLHLTIQNNIDDYFAIYKADELNYYLYFIPKLLYENFIVLFESNTPQVTTHHASKNDENENQSLQQIFYGAPGTGKSHKIKENEEVKKANDNNLVFRTTFHPDSDYSTFVGAYKPSMKPVADKYKAVAGKDEEITYSFVPQAFLQAYAAAWNNVEDNVFLVIEEINRGNCAQIFGDLFQLLDRDKDGYSEYSIMADNDIAKYLNGKDEKGQDVLTNKDGIKDGKLRLPKNLYIWATMNTSDQSLFPVDSAFKRRWDWVYIPIAKSNEDEFFIKVGDKCYDWWTFISQMNSVVESVTSSEDKQLGYYFCKPDEGIFISAKRFVSKVLFYLWNDVFKNYGFDATLDGNKVFACKDGNGKDAIMTFTSFFEKNGNPNLKQIEQLMKNLGIGPEENIPQTTATTNGPKPKRNYDKFVIEGETVEHPKYEIASEVVRKYIKKNNGKTAQEVAGYWRKLMENKVGIPNFIMTKVEYDNQKSKTAKSKSNEIECGDGEFVYVTTHLWGDDFGYISKFEEAVNNATELGIKIRRVPKD